MEEIEGERKERDERERDLFTIHVLLKLFILERLMIFGVKGFDLEYYESGTKETKDIKYEWIYFIDFINLNHRKSVS